MSYLGDIRLGDTIDFKFVTTAAATGAPTTLSGSPVISAYPGNSTTQLTAGITLSVDFDSVTGLNNVRVVASGGNGYATATNYEMVITTGTVGGTSAVGYVVGTFSIENRSAVMPTTATRTLDISANGEAGLDINNIATLTPGPIPALGIAENGTAQAGSTSTTLVGRAAMSLADNIARGGILYIYGGTGAVQSRVTTAFVGSTDTWTVDPAWTTTPDNTSTYIYLAGAQAPTGSPLPVNMTQILGTAVSTPATAGILDVNVKNIDNDAASASGTVTFPSATLASTTNITAGTITTVTNLTNAPTNGDLTAVMKTSVTTAATAATPTIASVSGSVGSVTGNVGGNVVGSVGSVTGAVGSVTGNVGGNVVGSVASVSGNVGGNVNGSVASVVANVNADIKKVNAVTVNGNGSTIPWGP